MKYPLNADSVTLRLFNQTLWWDIEKSTQEKNPSNATYVTLPLFKQTVWAQIWNSTMWKILQMQPVCLCLGEKSFKCNLCDFASVQADSLRTNLKYHYGKKSFKCNQCGFASFQAGDFRTHLKIHSGGKSLKWKQCDFASVQSDSLIREPVKKVLADFAR